jgi:hypothetical protein
MVSSETAFIKIISAAQTIHRIRRTHRLQWLIASAAVGIITASIKNVWRPWLHCGHISPAKHCYRARTEAARLADLDGHKARGLDRPQDWQLRWWLRDWRWRTSARDKAVPKFIKSSDLRIVSQRFTLGLMMAMPCDDLNHRLHRNHRAPLSVLRPATAVQPVGLACPEELFCWRGRAVPIRFLGEFCSLD